MEALREWVPAIAAASGWVCYLVKAVRDSQKAKLTRLRIEELEEKNQENAEQARLEAMQELEEIKAEPKRRELGAHTITVGMAGSVMLGCLLAVSMPSSSVDDRLEELAVELRSLREEQTVLASLLRNSETTEWTPELQIAIAEYMKGGLQNPWGLVGDFNGGATLSMLKIASGLEELADDEFLALVDGLKSEKLTLEEAKAKLGKEGIEYTPEVDLGLRMLCGIAPKPGDKMPAPKPDTKPEPGVQLQLVPHEFKKRLDE